jgi:hypothetical protein
VVRTVISIEEDDKKWLDARAEAEGVPMTELIRRAIRLLRAQTGSEYRTWTELHDATSGTWRRGDGLAWQRKLRREW